MSTTVLSNLSIEQEIRRATNAEPHPIPSRVAPAPQAKPTGNLSPNTNNAVAWAIRSWPRCNSPIARLVLTALADCSNGNLVRPDLTRLAARCGVGAPVVKLVLERLQEAGLIKEVRPAKGQVLPRLWCLLRDPEGRV